MLNETRHNRISLKGITKLKNPLHIPMVELQRYVPRLNCFEISAPILLLKGNQANITTSVILHEEPHSTYYTHFYVLFFFGTLIRATRV